MEENKIQLFDNDNLKLKERTIKNNDGSISINAEDTARGFGWVQYKKDKEYVKWERVNEFLSDWGISPLMGKGDYIPESVFYILGMKAKNNIAKEFQKWIAFDVIPSIRKTGQYIEKTNNSSVNQTIKGLDEKLIKLDEYFKPTHKRKLDINRYIKTCLGVNSSRQNADRVKEILLTRLGNYHTYEEIPKDILHSKQTSDLIFEICSMINNQYGKVQQCMF